VHRTLRGYLRWSGALGALIALVLIVFPAPATASTIGTPVLGKSLLSADQIADWYASTGIRSTSPTDIRTLARIFIDEGDAQGVRGDIAFAQSMLETGYLRFGGQVRPSDHNFSGLGACDSCRRGLAFPDPVIGVRAQIQHLWAYASPSARADATARPNVDIRFDLVNPKGRAPLWEQMGGGNWATDPGYAGKVLRIYGDMLRWAGIAAPSPTAPPESIAVPRATARATSGGGAWVAGWLAHRAPIDRARTLFGPPESFREGPAGCLLRWDSRGVVVLSDGPCDAAGTSARWVRLLNGWATQRGLAVGDPLARVSRLYPAAQRRGIQRWLVSGRDPGSRILRPRLRAEIRGGKVRALTLSPRRVIPTG
jgi:hypothetical protein